MLGIWIIAAYNGVPLLSPAIFVAGALLFPIPLAGFFGGLSGGVVGAAIDIAIMRIRSRAIRILAFVAVALVAIVGSAAIGVGAISLGAGLEATDAATIGQGLLAATILTFVAVAIVALLTAWGDSSHARPSRGTTS